jgi:hypothetical protein
VSILIALPNPKYHVYIEYSEPDKSGFRFNISRAELIGSFQEPFANGEPFWLMGRLLTPIKVVKVVLFWSYQTADQLRLPNLESIVVAKDKKYVIDNILKGKVKGAYICTEEFIAPTKKTPSPLNSTSRRSDSNWHTRRIIVVSGADETMKQTLTVALRKLGLASVVMSEEPAQGKKLVDRYKEYADVGIAVVLLSPDIYFTLKVKKYKGERTPRQDVLFMLGFF